MCRIIKTAKQSPRTAIVCLVSAIVILSVTTWCVFVHWNTVFARKPVVPSSTQPMVTGETTSPASLAELLAILNTRDIRLESTRLPAADIQGMSNVVRRRIQGSLLGLAVGDAFGAPYEFTKKATMDAKPATSRMLSGGPHRLKAGQWTDDTSMALCLAASLLNKNGCDAYDQLARYAWWYRAGYLSSTGRCFDIGISTRMALERFIRRRERLATWLGVPASSAELDLGVTREQLQAYRFDTRCGEPSNAGNGSLMRLAPIPLFFFSSSDDVLRYAEESSALSHEGQRAIDACRFYAALIAGAVNGLGKEELMAPGFYESFSRDAQPLCADIADIAQGSYKVGSRDERVHGTGYVVDSLKAALWALYNDEGSFERGVLLAVNLGEDTDTTAAIYGQLAGAVYGMDAIPNEWRKTVYYSDFIVTLADWLYLMGERRHAGKVQ